MSQPIVKTFDSRDYLDKISYFNEKMIETEFEKVCLPIACDILKNYEGFERVEEGPTLRGRPFDVFGYKHGLPYIIEVKGSLKRFQTPGELQKQRLQLLLSKVKELHIALLQIKVRTREYRMQFMIQCFKNVT
jgi:hypothetical protein